MGKQIKQKTGIQLIADERNKQIKILGFTPAKDLTLNRGQLLQLAVYCIFSNNENLPRSGWSMDYLKQLHMKSRIEQLTIAGALIAAAIDVDILLRKQIENRIEEEMKNL